MKKIIITGFDPFDGENINPSYEVAKKIKLKDYEIIRVELSTSFFVSSERLIKLIDIEKPDVVLMLGQAGGRENITPEMNAKNIINARIKDNSGNEYQDKKIIEDGEYINYTNIDILNIVKKMKDEGYKIEVSYSAGEFVCNELFYSISHHLKGKDIKFDFIHVPYILLQDKTPSMDIEDIVKTIERFISLI